MEEMLVQNNSPNRPRLVRLFAEYDRAIAYRFQCYPGNIVTISPGCVDIINISRNPGKNLVSPQVTETSSLSFAIRKTLLSSHTIVAKSRTSPVATDFYHHLLQSHKIIGKSCGYGNIIVFDDPSKMFNISRSCDDIIISFNCSKLLNISCSNKNIIVSQNIKRLARSRKNYH